MKINKQKHIIKYIPHTSHLFSKEDGLKIRGTFNHGKNRVRRERRDD